jgi:hypothetical protein
MVCQRTINPHGLPWGCCKVGVSGVRGPLAPEKLLPVGRTGGADYPLGVGTRPSGRPTIKGLRGTASSRTRLVSALHGLGSYLTASQAWHTLDGTLHRNEIDYQARIGQWSRAFRRIWLKPRFQVTMSAGLLVPIELRCAPEAWPKNRDRSANCTSLREIVSTFVVSRFLAGALGRACDPV